VKQRAVINKSLWGKLKSKAELTIYAEESDDLNKQGLVTSNAFVEPSATGIRIFNR